ncbi:sugar transferase [Lachnospiraceae bacterium 62-26]
MDNLLQINSVVKCIFNIMNSFYLSKGKRFLDIIFAFGGCIVFAPLYGVISIAIMIDDPGPVFFTQKRIGKGKKIFNLHKFRSMKMSTPHDIPTHQLTDPDQYITEVGKILRKYSLDELPQLWDIFVGNMSIIGPRPALWNQSDLVSERDKYGANDVLPGLTGWAQVNGRDELEIVEKARLDGEYVKKISFLFDMKCFFRTITSVLKADGIVEGGTGELYKKKKGCREMINAESKDYGHLKTFIIDRSVNNHKKVLITGAHSYIGESFSKWVEGYYKENISIDTIDMRKELWRKTDFSGYDAVFHVAGIAHADVGKVDEETKAKYYKINTELAIETACKARDDNVDQFVFMSSMIVYGESGKYGKKRIIDADTLPVPANFYGDSKWKAEKGIRALSCSEFKVAVIRPPMVYGKESKGNYQVLSKAALIFPFFPDINNERSMLHIDNLCEFLCQLILSGEGGIYFPQNTEYTKTTEMIKKINEVHGRTIWITRLLNPIIVICSYIPGKVSGLVNKAFGNMVYDQKLSRYKGMNYRVNDLAASIKRTERNDSKKVLIVASVASMIDQFNIQNISLLRTMGFSVDVACNFLEGNTCSKDRIKKLLDRLNELEVNSFQVDFDRKGRNIKCNMTAFMQLDSILRRKAVPIKGEKNQDNSSYTFIHCHSPIGGMIGRIVAKKNNVKTIYTAHGFHFYSGAPKMNWITFYPVEKILSRITDVLIIITREDYGRAVKQLSAKKVYYCPGIGVDIDRFSNVESKQAEKRKVLGFEEDAVILLSVGELNDNKNHKVIIKAMNKIKNINSEYYKYLHYCIAGKGELKKQLELLANELGVSNHIHFLGFREDITEIFHMADVFLLPSKREGLNVSLMEAMASGLPCIVSDIRGNDDLIKNINARVKMNSDNEMEWAVSIMKMKDERYREALKKENLEHIQKFSLNEVLGRLEEIYKDVQR